MVQLVIPQRITEMKTVHFLRRELLLLAKTTYWIRSRLGANSKQALRYAGRYWLPEFIILKQWEERLTGKVFVMPEWRDLARLVEGELELDDWQMPEMPPLPPLTERRTPTYDGCAESPEVAVFIVREILMSVQQVSTMQELHQMISRKTGKSSGTVKNTATSWLIPEERCYVFARLANHESGEQWRRIIWPEMQVLLPGERYENFLQLCKKIQRLCGFSTERPIRRCVLEDASVAQIEAIRARFPNVLGAALGRARAREGVV